MLALMLTAFASVAIAQERPAPAFDKWRPKAGAYAEPGKNFESNWRAGNSTRSCSSSGLMTRQSLSRKA
jgi:hypothetical protein